MGGIIDNKSGDCNFLFIISAPSGTGKTTICKRLLQQNKDLCLSISATTRAPRTGEVDGKDYFFITKEEYLAKVNTGGFLEHACVFDNYYGTPLDFVHKKISSGVNIIFDIDWQGMRKIKSVERFNVSTLFLVPPSIDVLRDRLKNRGDSQEQIDKRIAGFVNDAEKANEYDYVIVNDDLEETCNIVNSIYQAEKIKFSRRNVLTFVNDITEKCRRGIFS